MEMSGFTEEQLTVREAIQKICSNFPNVCLDSGDFHHLTRVLTSFRTTGRSMIRRGSILMSCTQLCRRMVGLELLCQKILEVPVWEYQKRP